MLQSGGDWGVGGGAHEGRAMGYGRGGSERDCLSLSSLKAEPEIEV